MLLDLFSVSGSGPKPLVGVSVEEGDEQRLGLVGDACRQLEDALLNVVEQLILVVAEVGWLPD